VSPWQAAKLKRIVNDEFSASSALTRREDVVLALRLPLTTDSRHSPAWPTSGSALSTKGLGDRTSRGDRALRQ